MSSCAHSPALLCPQPEEVAQEAAEEPLIEPLMEPEGESYEGTPQVRGSQGWEGASLKMTSPLAGWEVPNVRSWTGGFNNSGSRRWK